MRHFLGFILGRMAAKVRGSGLGLRVEGRSGLRRRNRGIDRETEADSRPTPTVRSKIRQCSDGTSSGLVGKVASLDEAFPCPGRVFSGPVGPSHVSAETRAIRVVLGTE